MFYLNKMKASPKTDKIPMYVRVTLNRQKAESRLNLEIRPEDIQKWNGKIMRFEDRTMSANSLLNTIDKNFEDFRHHNATTLHKYDVRAVRDIIIGVDRKPSTKIVHYVDKYYNSAIGANAQMADGTKTNYRKALTHFKNFLRCEKKLDAMISEVNIELAFQFKDYLLGDTTDERKGMNECSALNNIKRLRTIFDRAVDEELIPNNPFKKIKLKGKSAPRGRLDIHQVKQIYDLDLKEFPTQQVYRDMFLFCVFTGLAYTDTVSLKQSDLSLIRESHTKLFLKRAKTDIITEMILPRQAMEIVNKYRQTTEIQITKGVLPKRSNKEVNVQLKILANMVNISVKLSTHIARHTFRQLLAEADVCEMGIIKRMMGHSSANDIDGIYYYVTEGRLLEAKRKFELYLEKSLEEKTD